MHINTDTSTLHTGTHTSAQTPMHMYVFTSKLNVYLETLESDIWKRMNPANYALL